MRSFDILQHRFVLRTAGFKNHIVVVFTNARLIRWDRHHFEAVNIEKFLRLRFRRSRHARQFFIHAEVILQCNRRIGLGFFLGT